MKFADIPLYTTFPEYGVDVAWSSLERHLEEMLGLGLNLNPDFQRAHVWTEPQQAAYVEHVLKGGWASRQILFNCPSWRMGGKDVVLVDGKQRLEAARKFMRNDLVVFGKYKRDDFTDSPGALVACFRFCINELETRAAVLQWYLELNAGGTPHTKAELEKVRLMLVYETAIAPGRLA